MKCSHYPIFGNDLWVDGGSNEDWIVKVCTRCGLEEYMPRNKSNLEFVPDAIKEQRKEYARDLIQPTRDGTISREYLEIYGDKNMKLTEKEKKSAKYVWEKDVLKGVNWRKQIKHKNEKV